jgi:hypothetical protein
MTDILIKAVELAAFLRLDRVWRSQLPRDRLELPSEHELVWLPQSD